MVALPMAIAKTLQMIITTATLGQSSLHTAASLNAGAVRPASHHSGERGDEPGFEPTGSPDASTSGVRGGVANTWS